MYTHWNVNLWRLQKKIRCLHGGLGREGIPIFSGLTFEVFGILYHTYLNVNFKDHCAKSNKIMKLWKDLICGPQDKVRWIQTQNLSLIMKRCDPSGHSAEDAWNLQLINRHILNTSFPAFLSSFPFDMGLTVLLFQPLWTARLGYSIFFLEGYTGK